MATLFLMSGATIAMGLAPDFATLGIAAPVLIVALRILQGLAVGGEYARAAFSASRAWAVHVLSAEQEAL